MYESCGKFSCGKKKKNWSLKLLGLKIFIWMKVEAKYWIYWIAFLTIFSILPFYFTTFFNHWIKIWTLMSTFFFLNFLFNFFLMKSSFFLFSFCNSTFLFLKKKSLGPAHWHCPLARPATARDDYCQFGLHGLAGMARSWIGLSWPSTMVCMARWRLVGRVVGTLEAHLKIWKPSPSNFSF